ncbi:MAG: helix-turn-helix domain-containing protein [Lachnospiraceae bacterium]|nr:helix-turn-helix domain-containing protein [Lachnospiraceae bacterium]
MAVYRVGSVIKTLREYKGYSREKLEEESGVSAKTIARIEKTGSDASPSTYIKLFNTLFPGRERYYAPCSSADVGIMEEKGKVESYIAKYDYEKADEVMKVIENKLNGTGDVNLQFLNWKRAYLDYVLKRADKEQTKEKYLTELKRTCPNIEDILANKIEYPLTTQEINIIYNYIIILKSEKKTKECIEILSYLDNCLKDSYVLDEETLRLKIVIRDVLAICIEDIGDLEEAFTRYNQEYNDSKNDDYGVMLLGILYDIAWSSYKMILGSEQGDTSRLKQILQQNYYAAMARNDEYIMKLTLRLYEEIFKKPID